MRNVLYDPQWQKMRVSFLTEYSPFGGFSTPQGTLDNLQRLNQYIEAAKSDYPEYAVRVWRGLNMLNATREGFSGIGQRGSESDEAVRQYRDQLQEYYDPHTVAKVDDSWDWDSPAPTSVKSELEVMWANDRYWFTAIYQDLRHREHRTQRQQGVADISGTRSELSKFLRLMEAVDITGAATTSLT